MPVLTDRQEPEDFDRDRNPEEPNEYAIKYLFKPRAPTIERWRTGRVILYSGAAANLLASFMLPLALELRLPLSMLLFSMAILVATGLAAWQVWRLQHEGGEFWLSLLPLLLLLAGLAYALFLDLLSKDVGLLVFYLPGSLSMLMGALVLLPKKS